MIAKALQHESSPMLSLQGVSKLYERAGETLRVLARLDLEIAEGEFLALMGPSGSGKSTLLNLIVGLDKPTSGRVEVAGTKLSELSEGELARWRSRNVGLIFQLYHLLPVLTAVENVELPLLLAGLSAKERRRRALTALRLDVSEPERITYRCPVARKPEL